MMNTLLAIVSSISLGAASAPIADIFVDQNAGNCQSGTGGAADPVCSINDAVALAQPGDTIRIAPGTYIENLALNFDLELVGLDGPSVTVVDGAGAGRVVTIAQAISVSLVGLTLTGGVAGPVANGGGIHSQGDLTLLDSVVAGNSAGVSGGGIYSDTGNLTIRNSTITGNTAGGAGGGLASFKSSTVVAGSEISGNQASSAAGISLHYSGGELSGLVIRDNHASGMGGGLAFSCLGAFLGYGAGYSSGYITIRACEIADNSASFGGGISIAGCFSDEIGFPSAVIDCTISGNTATSSGGGVFAEIGAPTALRNTTITGNSAGLDGGGLQVNLFYLGAYVSVSSSIIAGNTAAVLDMSDLGGNFGPAYPSGAVALVVRSLVGIASVNSALIDGQNGNQVGSVANPLDALLGPILDNGGPTRTHAPSPNSPAIDVAGLMNFAPTDQRGYPRPIGGDSDLGALEVQNYLCNGDGGNQTGCTRCPCMNEAPAGTTGGCLNSAGSAARLLATGDPSVSLPAGADDDLRFSLSGAPPSAFCLLTSGDSVAPTNPANVCFGMNSGVQSVQFDGLRCAVENTRRHGGRAADSSGAVGSTNNPWGGEGGPPVGLAQAGSGIGAGQTRYFQAITRDDVSLSCMRGLNTSQAIEITFAP